MINRITEKCDMYSLGVLLYYMMYGCYPFEECNQMVLAKKIIKGEIKKPPLGKEKQYSSNLKRILGRLLELVCFLLYFFIKNI
jgi:serine/threonine protein kinase